MTTRTQNLSQLAGVRISPPLPEDAGVVHFEMFVKATGEVVSRGTSEQGFRFIIRGKDRRRSPRIRSKERRILQPGCQIPDYQA